MQTFTENEDATFTLFPCCTGATFISTVLPLEAKMADRTFGTFMEITNGMFIELVMPRVMHALCELCVMVVLWCFQQIFSTWVWLLAWCPLASFFAWSCYWEHIEFLTLRGLNSPYDGCWQKHTNRYFLYLYLINAPNIQIWIQTKASVASIGKLLKLLSFR